jgi:ribulose 1,5-bisphosphate carboxylase large subunit-like protein
MPPFALVRIVFARKNFVSTDLAEFFAFILGKLFTFAHVAGAKNIPFDVSVFEVFIPKH